MSPRPLIPVVGRIGADGVRMQAHPPTKRRWMAVAAALGLILGAIAGHFVAAKAAYRLSPMQRALIEAYDAAGNS